MSVENKTMDVETHVVKRIAECDSECARYTRWLSKLRLPNSVLVGLGSLLAFLGGAAMLAEVFGSGLTGAMALIGGALTGLHSWFGCEAHQTECRKLLGQFESLKSRYETVQVEPDEGRRLERFRELEMELAKVKEERKARPWNGFLDCGRKT